MTTITERPLSFGQAAIRLGVHVDVVRRWARTEQIPVVTVGRCKRIPRDWVDAQQEG